MHILNILVGLFLGFGAVQELIERGILGREVQPAILGAAGAVAAGLLIASGITRMRHLRLDLAAALLTIAVHVYGVLPPHANIGALVFLIGTGYGAALLVIATMRRRRGHAPAV